MEQEEADARPVKVRSCAIEAGAEGVRFVVDGQVVKAMPFDAYETFHKNLTRGVEFNIYPLATPDGGEIKVQLCPLSEIRAGRIVLHSSDGVTYGRQYRLIGVEKIGGSGRCAIIGLADTGEAVEREPWDGFKQRVEVGRCRGGTAYGTMLGEFNDRLYFDVTGQIYKSEEERLKEKEAESADTKAAEEKEKTEEEPAEEEHPQRMWIAAARLWLRTHPGHVYIAAAISLVVLLVGVYRAYSGPRVQKLSPEAVSAAQQDDDLNKQYKIARALSAVDLAEYARKNPQAARDSVRNLAAFVEKTHSATHMTAEQSKKLNFISDTVPRLQAELEKAPQK